MMKREQIAIEKIYVPTKRRATLNDKTADEIAESILANGQQSPILVRPDGDAYELIAGERRWRASQLAGLSSVPVIVKETTPQQMLELAIVENIQRADLNPLEEADEDGYQHGTETGGDVGFGEGDGPLSAMVVREGRLDHDQQQGT